MSTYMRAIFPLALEQVKQLHALEQRLFRFLDRAQNLRMSQFLRQHYCNVASDGGKPVDLAKSLSRFLCLQDKIEIQFCENDRAPRVYSRCARRGKLPCETNR